MSEIKEVGEVNVANENAVKEVKEWTLMFYFASDNPLASHIVSQLKAIKAAGFHQEVNVIAYFDPQTRNTPSHVFDVNRVEKLRRNKQSRFCFRANDPFVRNLVFDKLWTEENPARNSVKSFFEKNFHIPYDLPSPDGLDGEQSPKGSLGTFLKFCAEKYQARHYMLIILGHGVVVGNDIFLFDENIPDADGASNIVPALTSSDGPNTKKTKRGDISATAKKSAEHSVTLKDLGEVLETFKSNETVLKNKSQLELIGLHSCSMSGLELAYQIHDKAKYLLASQGPAFVGSWPYKQMLLRVFNDLEKNSKDVSFNAHDFKFPELVAKLKKADHETLLGFFKDAGILDRYKEAEELQPALIGELNELLKNPMLHQSDWASRVESKETEELRSGQPDPQGLDLMWLNRMLLQDAFRDEMNKRKRKRDLKRMLTKIFSYCVSNSYDFQLAGYSFDMALCDLSKLKDEKKGIEVPLRELISALREGLKEDSSDKNGIIKEMILLAHWDAQSFFQEQYTDLYDFCFCLRSRCRPFEEASPTVGRILTACKNVMTALKCDDKDKHRRKRESDNQAKYREKISDTLIMRSDFIGPASQYSHGLSVFFPWSEPVDPNFMGRYKEYAFTKDFIPKGMTEADFKDTWIGFLETYFEKTKRHPRRNERDEEVDGIVVNVTGDASKRSDLNPDEMERELLEVLQAISKSITRDDGQSLNNKVGAGDPTGDACECPSIKNYPSSTKEEVPVEDVSVSNTLIAQISRQLSTLI